MTTIPLWSDPVPNALGATQHDRPTLDIYDPYGSTFQRTAALVLPGGGYGVLASHEGEGFASVLRMWGIKVFVCNYRLGSQGYRHPVMLQDAARALRTIRANAAEYGIDPDKIFVMGSSAGGHLAATLLTKWDIGQPNHSDRIERVSSRPNAGVLCYPVISMLELGHAGSRENLLGKSPSPELIRQLSAELHVNADTPPCFIWHTVEDPVVPLRNSIDFAMALHAANVPFDLHCFEKGQHGLGMHDGRPWVPLLIDWLKHRF